MRHDQKNHDNIQTYPFRKYGMNSGRTSPLLFLARLPVNFVFVYSYTSLVFAYMYTYNRYTTSPLPSYPASLGAG